MIIGIGSILFFKKLILSCRQSSLIYHKIIHHQHYKILPRSIPNNKTFCFSRYIAFATHLDIQYVYIHSYSNVYWIYIAAAQSARVGSKIAAKRWSALKGPWLHGRDSRSGGLLLRVPVHHPSSQGRIQRWGAEGGGGSSPLIVANFTEHPRAPPRIFTIVALRRRGQRLKMSFQPP